MDVSSVDRVVRRKLKFSVRPWTSWDADMQSKLRGLTLDPYLGFFGGMNVYCDKYPDAFDTWVALRDDEPVGWALRVHTTYSDGGWGVSASRGRGWAENRQPVKGEAMFYVHPDHRRKGIGLALLDLLDRDRGPGIVTPWDDASEGFYRLARGWDLRREDC